MASSSQPSVSSDLLDDLHEMTKALCANPDDIRLAIARAESLTKLGRFREAMSQFNSSVRKHFSVPELHEKRLIFFLSLGIYEKAKGELFLVRPVMRESLGIQIEELESLSIKMSDLRHAGRWDEALDKVENAIALGVENSKTILVFKAEILVRLGRFCEAKEVFCKAVEMQAEPVELYFDGMELRAYIHLVSAYMQLSFGKIVNAVGEAKDAYVADKKNKEIFYLYSNFKEVRLSYEKGIKLYGDGKYAEAEKEFFSALGLSKCKSISLWNSIAACYLHLKRWKKCIAITDMVLRWLPDDEKAKELCKNARAEIEKEAVKDVPEDEKAKELLKKTKSEIEKDVPKDEKAKELLKKAKSEIEKDVPEDEKAKDR